MDLSDTVPERSSTVEFYCDNTIYFYHWSVNDDTCAMTQLEMMLTNQEKDKTFMHRVVSPIYKMEENDVNKLAK